MMRRLEMSDGTVWATNAAGRGVFYRRIHIGAYHQLAGTGQTPIFHTPQQFRRYLRERHGLTGVRVVDTWGWDKN